METIFRRAVRVVCLDAGGRVLLMRWRDPVSGNTLWEPPGGGVDPGEDDLTAARRELAEETGLDPAAVGEASVAVERDVIWAGKNFVGTESFFLACFATDEPALDGAGRLDYENEQLVDTRWTPLEELAGVESLEPPRLAEVIAALRAG
ncbi:NUDIX domain-containing protein [Actinorhabdospora filicis]|nr:NUDIX domain-containing protein [Actinorhabdospora filicis]